MVVALAAQETLTRIAPAHVSSDSRSMEITPSPTLACKFLVRLDKHHYTNRVLNIFSFLADGTRNEVGLRFDSQGRLWGVEVR